MDMHAPGGFIGGQLYRRAFDQQQRANEIEMEGGQLDNSTKELQLGLARKAMIEQAAVEEHLRKIPGLSELATTDPAEYMAKVAGVQAEEGHPMAAIETIGKASKANQASAAAANSKNQAIVRRAGLTGAAFANVKDDIGWKAAVAGLMANFPEEKDAYQQLLELPHKAQQSSGYFDYAKVAGAISDSALTEVQRAQKEQSEASALNSRASAWEHSVRAKTLIPAMAEAQKALAVKRGKFGVSSADKLTISDAKRQIMSNYKVEADEANVLAIDVAERATQIAQEHDNITKADALKMAMKEKSQSDLFAGIQRKAPTAGRKEAPRDLPIVDDKIAVGQLKHNEFYQTKGGLLLWDANTVDPKTGKKGVFRRAQEHQLPSIPEGDDEELVEQDDGSGDDEENE